MDQNVSTIKFSKDCKPGFLSVVMPVYNDCDGLKITLDSLFSQTQDRDSYEIVVANDGGNKDITALCHKYGVKVVEIIPNGGSYFARNRALEKTSGEYIAFVDADISVGKTWLENGLKKLKDYDYIGGPVCIDETMIKTFASKWDKRTAFPVSKFMQHTHFAPTANLFVRRRVLEKLGGFDERLKSGGDVEFGDRVFRSTVFTQYYDEDIAVIHPPREKNEIIRKVRRVKEGQIYLFELFPERFLQLKPNALDIFKGFLPPVGFLFLKDCYFKERMAFFLIRWKIKRTIAATVFNYFINKKPGTAKF